MKIEIREDSVMISGYVNAVERLSKPIKMNIGGKIKTFLEKIKSGTFKSALNKTEDVPVLLNHDHGRKLASTKEGTATLEEDNIGLRAEITIKDPEVIEKAREGKLSGWSFGFRANADEFKAENEAEVRTLTDIDLLEVSILDDTKRPAYYGTSIEAREEGEKPVEIRSMEVETKEDSEEREDDNEARMEALADKIAKKVIEAMKPVEESRGIDYSAFEDRIKKITK